MYVICFYWEGERWNGDREMAARYVNNLYRGVERFASESFEFICFTNVKLNVDRNVTLRPFPLVSKRGVLPRIWMFSESSGLFGEQVLCLDLDIVITGLLKDLMDYRGTFCVRRSFHDKTKIDGDIMSFKAGKENEERFWKPFVNDIQAVEELTSGRERYWVRHVAEDIADRWDRIAPKQIYSYKYHIRRTGELPEGTTIVSCHGEPMPHQITNDWIKEYWGYHEKD